MRKDPDDLAASTPLGLLLRLSFVPVYNFFMLTGGTGGRGDNDCRDFASWEISLRARSEEEEKFLSGQVPPFDRITMKRFFYVLLEPFSE